ncbi:MAG: hypothetical protein ACLT1O_00185, partial [Bifidobacterium pseudocatenulatum]
MRNILQLKYRNSYREASPPRDDIIAAYHRRRTAYSMNAPQHITAAAKPNTSPIGLPVCGIS